MEPEFELADIAMIAQLLESRRRPKPARLRKQERVEAPVACAKRRRCDCGKCRACLDNARWESVFQQKFADPYYYSDLLPRHESSLSGL